MTVFEYQFLTLFMTAMAFVFRRQILGFLTAIFWLRLAFMYLEASSLDYMLAISSMGFSIALLLTTAWAWKTKSGEED